ncbi:basic proline-rich protein-like [Dermochelys coriacea]|uniref:basic proline-rich protein-like n=1 Tax=Dermochelys coriacea TaxID=27794 RepID=UPI0018E7D8DD|nr:basic proline-rich protein-like [Dermochelys coriacea]
METTSSQGVRQPLPRPTCQGKPGPQPAQAPQALATPGDTSQPTRRGAEPETPRSSAGGGRRPRSRRGSRPPRPAGPGSSHLCRAAGRGPPSARQLLPVPGPGGTRVRGAPGGGDVGPRRTPPPPPPASGAGTRAAQSQRAAPRPPANHRAPPGCRARGWKAALAGSRAEVGALRRAAAGGPRPTPAPQVPEPAAPSPQVRGTWRPCTRGRSSAEPRPPGSSYLWGRARRNHSAGGGGETPAPLPARTRRGGRGPIAQSQRSARNEGGPGWDPPSNPSAPEGTGAAACPGPGKGRVLRAAPREPPAGQSGPVPQPPPPPLPGSPTDRSSWEPRKSPSPQSPPRRPPAPRRGPAPPPGGAKATGAVVPSGTW